jgi:DNA-binding transcriptional MerR regulator
MEVESRIPQKLFFRIGEVCDLIKVQPHVLRYWETEFPMLAPQKNRAGQRVYRRKDVEMVVRIHNLLYEEKFTIAGARKRLSEETRKGAAPRLKTSVREKTHEVERVNIDANVFDDGEDELMEVEDASTVLVSEPLPPKVEPPAAVVETTSSQLPKPEPPVTQTSSPINSPKTQQRLRFIKHSLEELLTLLKSDASINRSA